MAGRDNTWRHRGGARRLSMTEVSLTLSVILGLTFVSLRVMNTDGSLAWRQPPATDPVASSSPSPHTDH